MNDLQKAAKFRRGAGTLRRDGWTQFDIGIGERPHCAMGALKGDAGVAEEIAVRLPVPDLATFEPWLQRLYASGIAGNNPWTRVVVWNNTPGRTKEDVIALFEGLAHDLELRHQIATIPAESTPGIPTSPAESPLIKEAVGV